MGLRPLGGGGGGGGVDLDTLANTFAPPLFARSARGVNALSRCKTPQTLSDGTYADYTSRNYHKAAVGCYDLVFVFGNYYGADSVGPDDVTYRAAFEVAHPETPSNQGTSKFYPIYFDGKRDGVVAPGGLLVSQPVSVEVNAGASLYTRVRATSPAGRIPLGAFPNSSLYEGILVNAGTDLTTSGSIPAGTTIQGGGVPHWASRYKVNPVAIYAFPRGGQPVPFMVLTGDSITEGASRSSAFSYVEQALENAGIPYLNLAFSGEQAAAWAGTGGAFAGSGHEHRGRLIYGATDVWCGYGRNDVSASSSLGTIQASLIRTWRIGADRGARTWQPTITPRTTSTDSWATVVNQTINTTAQNTVRVNLNNWLRDGAPLNPSTFAAAATGATASATVVRAGADNHPLTGVVEVADTVESSRDSGLWKPEAGTTDGLHPGDAGHNLMAPAVPTLSFTAMP